MLNLGKVSNLLKPGTNTVLRPVAAEMVKRGGLQITHYPTMSKKEFQDFVNIIRADGIQESIKYVEYKGVKYIVNGHHRFFASQKIGTSHIPIEQVNLPYKGYQTIEDLLNLEGKLPSYWNYIK